MMIYRELHRMKLTKVRPEGWLKRQLEIQMQGLSGQLYDLWDTVGSYSGWLGGSGDGWERAPYYLDGLLPLAWYLDDQEHIALCLRFIEWTLGSQTPEGNFGPLVTRDDYWSRYVMLKVLAQYAELSDDDRVVPFMLRYFEYIASAVDTRPLTEWSNARVPDLLWCMKWAYEECGDERILAWAEKLDALAYDWVDFMSCLPFTRSAESYMHWEELNRLNRPILDQLVAYHPTHIVNVVMGVKHPAIRYAFTGDESLRETMYRGLADLKLRHGVASGCLNGDEHLAGNDPNRGAELCSVVEGMFSLAVMTEIFGNPALADVLERLAFNALPATISEDWMSHQYLQQANQVKCSDEKRPWFNNGPDSNLFGLEPNFGCCTANMHQGWPKLVNALWYRDGDMPVSMIPAPSEVQYDLPGGGVRILLDTEYPFRDTLTYRVTEAPQTGLTLKVRVPDWCCRPEIGGTPCAIKNGFLRLEGLCAGDTVTVRLPMEVKRSRWFHDSMAVERGPLVYALDIQERWSPYRSVAGVTDYQVFPDSPWNYALTEDGPAHVEERPVSAMPFSHRDAPVRLTVDARLLPSWQIDGGNAGTLPVSPVTPDTPLTRITLIPYGCTKLRISEFPVCE